MIKINLLGEDTSIDHSGRLILIGYVASVVGLAVLFIILQTSVASEVASVRDEVETLTSKLSDLKRVTQEVRDLEKEKQELDNITATVARLKLSQVGPVRVMDDLNVAVPTRGWMHEVDEKAGVMRITGLTLNDHDVVKFMKSLETSNFFESVDLVESTTVYLIKVSTYNWFNNKFTRYTVRAEEKEAQLRTIQQEAKRMGLRYQATSGPPVKFRGGGDVKIMSTGKTDSFSATAKLNSGVFKRGASRTELISAWSSVENVPAKNFSIMAKVLYPGKLRRLLAPDAKETIVSTVN